MKRTFILIFALGILFAMIGYATELTFWTAPNANQEHFWKDVLKEWSATHPNIEIKWSVIPAAGSSEEAILTAISTGKAPDICTNIFSGFAAQLIDASVIVPFDSFPDFKQLLQTRKMENAIKGWEYNKHYYVLPLYSNPNLVWWRKDLLKKYGFDRAPRTYDDIYALSRACVIPHKRYSYQFVKGRNWWDRWFDFITHYYAASGGKAYIDTRRNKAAFKNEYGEAVVEFLYTLFKNKWTAVDLGTDPFYNGTVLGMTNGPWELLRAKQAYPEIYKDKILLAPPPVPSNYSKDKPIYTFADTKGMVLFKKCKDKKAAWEFIKWVFTNVDHDKLWLEYTNMPPVREDLLTNPIFTAYFAKNLYAAKYAEYVPYAVPPALTDKTIDVQDAMTESLIEPLMYLKSTPEKALKDAVKKINDILWE
ncbi:MAG: carbohydrate ABC transporter substrate-binding protein [Thermotoga sp.]|nr:MAG: carbohydrate ABC transporter substrate-binding protein [Thermotoga sp.]